MRSDNRCAACDGRNGPSASFCRHCGAPIAPPTQQAASLVDQPQTRESVAPPSASELDESRIVRELFWLSGLPIVVSIALTITVRVRGPSALADLVAVLATAAIALGGALKNVRLVLSAIRVPAPIDLLRTFAAALIMAPALILAFWLLEQLGFPLYKDYFVAYATDGWPLWLGYVDIAVLTPVSEELLFRGLIQPKLDQLIRKPTETLVVQAALFSALHLSPVILVTHFAMGLVFGWLRLRTRSLFPSMLLHGAWNGWVVWSTAT